MQPIVSIGLGLGWLLAAGLAWRQYGSLKRAVSTLPEADLAPRKEVESGPHPILEQNLRRYLKLPPLPEDELAVVMFGSSTCGACSSQLESFLEVNRTLNAPFAAVIGNEDEERQRRYLEKYGSLFPVMPVHKEFLQMLQLTRFPTFVVMTGTGQVVKECPVYRAAVYHIEQARAAGNSGGVQDLKGGETT